MKTRDQFRRDHPYCQWPGCDRLGYEVHEIARGPARQAAMLNPAAMLHLCTFHHGLAHYVPSFVRDLAVKLLAGDGTYDRVAVNLIRGRAPESISEIEVRLVANMLRMNAEMVGLTRIHQYLKELYSLGIAT